MLRTVYTTVPWFAGRARGRLFWTGAHRHSLTALAKCDIIHVVNDIYSGPDAYLPRWLTPVLQAASAEHPVVVVTGARQTGKSTLLLNAEPFRRWRFLSLDDLAVLRQARERPEALWAGVDHVVLDEVQRAPELLSAVKLAVDQSGGRLRFALSGSASLLLMSRVSESLAGRAVYFVLHPMALGEMVGAAVPQMLGQALAGNLPEEGVGDLPPDPVDLILRGCMPALLARRSSQAWTQWWDGYVATYLERDLRQLSQIENLVDYRRLMDLLALRSAQLLNQSELGRDAGLSQPTVHRYLNLLETSHLFARLPAWLGNRSARLMKIPKAFWSDAGLAAFLCGYYDAETLRSGRELGALFETFISHHVRVLAGLMTPPARLYYWRTRSGAEVDLVVEHGRRLVAIEVKMADTVTYRDAAGLQTFLDANPQTNAGLLLYAGNAVRRLGEKIVALPWTMVTGQFLAPPPAGEADVPVFLARTARHRSGGIVSESPPTRLRALRVARGAVSGTSGKATALAPKARCSARR